ncbi:unnamed protein product, partial [Mesorhabditis belari]|uniref:Uncharacterized protein n=1 Tax=Mesorhabditis belari TaxID=2138241 RepID=A0AAF3JBX7_9BILA
MVLILRSKENAKKMLTGMADLYTHINLKTKLFDPKLKMITGPLARFHFDGKLECPRRAFQLPTIKGCGLGYQSCDAPSAICHQKPRNLAATSLTDVQFCVKELCDLTVLERRETLDGVWDELNALTNEYLSNQEPLLVISGCTHEMEGESGNVCY